jgi:alpha-D-ribose 1-methylphosphonate 5-triphosphate synthase subunit PhnL
MDRETAREAAVVSLRRLNIDEKLWDVHASVLSGGEKQRINLAAGTISAPQLLLLDEPVSALDPNNREAALDLIGDLTSHGVAVLAVFHDLEAMERLASRIVLMRNGQVEMNGTPENVLKVLAEGVPS